MDRNNQVVAMGETLCNGRQQGFLFVAAACGPPPPVRSESNDLIQALVAEHPGEVIPSKALIARVWGSQYAGESHYLRLYIRYLRQKLEDVPSEPAYILNRWGSGYSLDFPKRVAARAG